MPKHIIIKGGQPIGAPPNWDADKHGTCEALNVLIEETDGFRSFTSAYRMTPAEQQALAAGGELFLRILAHQHPVISMWVQNAGIAEPVGIGLEFDHTSDQVDAAETPGIDRMLLEIGFKAMMDELDAQAEQRSNSPEIGDPDEVGQVWMKGVFSMRSALEVAIEAMGASQTQQRRLRAEKGIIELPVMTLEALAAEHQAREAISGINPATAIVDEIAAREPDYGKERKLPEGLTCADCQNGKRCDGLFGAVRRGFTACDFWPSRFNPIQPVDLGPHGDEEPEKGDKA